jgi:hypothetical protein
MMMTGPKTFPDLSVSGPELQLDKRVKGALSGKKQVSSSCMHMGTT